MYVRMRTRRENIGTDKRRCVEFPVTATSVIRQSLEIWHYCHAHEDIDNARMRT